MHRRLNYVLRTFLIRWVVWAALIALLVIVFGFGMRGEAFDWRVYRHWFSLLSGIVYGLIYGVVPAVMSTALFSAAIFWRKQVAENEPLFRRMRDR